MKKWIWIYMLAVSLISYKNVSYAVETEDAEFEGNRKLCVVISQSDLENYISGGRYSLEMLFRTCGFDWLNYRIYTSDRDTYTEISYEFDSFNDYVDKTEQLLGYEPLIVYFTENGIVYEESFPSVELMNWLFQELAEKELVSEYSAEDLFVIEDSRLYLFGEEHVSFENMDLRQEELPSIVEQLSIRTRKAADGKVERSINFSMAEEVWETRGKQYFEKNEEYAGLLLAVNTQNGQTDISCEMSAYSYREIANQTFVLLGVPDVLKQEQEWDGSGLQTHIREIIDFQKLMSEDCAAEIVYELPDREGEIMVLSEAGEVEEDRISYQNMEPAWIEYSYPDLPQFQEVSIHTRVGGLLGRKERVMVFKIKKNLAENFHEDIKSILEERMIRGTVLNIYDEGEERNYEVCFSSYMDSQILEFTEQILGAVGTLQIENNGYFFDESTIQESIRAADFLNGYQKPENFRISYELPAGSIIQGGKESLETDLYENGRIDIRYRYFDWKIWAGAYGIIFVTFFYIKIVFGKYGKGNRKR